MCKIDLQIHNYMSKQLTEQQLIINTFVNTVQSRVIQDVIINNQAKILAILNNSDYKTEKDIIDKDIAKKMSATAVTMVDTNTDPPTGL